jgi:diguanylate cyclase (GGDEF)-like protein/PAS domain S-box-containing protein
MICISLYSLGYAITLSYNSIESILTGIKIEYTGIVFIPVFWIIFAVKYSGLEIKNRRYTYPLLLIIPLITLTLVYTSQYHHLYYRSLTINETKYFSNALVEKGIWYFVHLIYNNVIILVGNLFFFRLILGTSGYLRIQASLTFTASIIPWIGDTLYLTGLTVYNLDYTPFLLTIMGSFLLLALFRYKMFDLTPIARSIVFNEMRDPVIVLDNENRLVDFNHAAHSFFKTSKDELIGLQAGEVLKHYDDFYNQLITNDMKAIEFQEFNNEEINHYTSYITPIYSRSQRLKGKILTIQDITSEKMILKRLNDLATIDELTGINNRRSLRELCTVELHKANRFSRPLSILLMDIDFFKNINDTYGHLAGDEVLRLVAQSFQKNLRLCDITGRYGGEEFVIALPETGKEEAKEVAYRIKKNIATLKIAYEVNIISLTISIGVYTIDSNDSKATIEYAFSKADEALYRAKNSGRNKVVVYTP